MFAGFNGRITAGAKGVMVDFLPLLDLMFPLVSCRYVSYLFTGLNLEESGQAVKRVEHLSPGYLIEGVRIQYLEFRENLSCNLPVHPEAKLRTGIWGELVATNPDRNRFQRKGLLGQRVKTHPAPYDRFSTMVSPTIQLGRSAQLSIINLFVLMGANMKVF